jgi:hypothetical protein
VKSFLLFLRRVWAGLKAVCTKQDNKPITGNTVTLHSDVDTLVSQDLVEVFKNAKLEAKHIARQQLADAPRMSRNKYRDVLEEKTNEIFNRILGCAASPDLCLA